MNALPASDQPPAEFLSPALATERQQKYVRDLLVAADKLTPEIDAMIPTLSRATVSKWIERAKTLPRPAPQALGDVPAGRYAVWMEEAQAIRFYHVQRPTEGRWAGYVFVKVQASDDLHPIKNRQARDKILELIAADPAAASLAYGRELGHCGVCGRTLTHPESIDRGIGPICAEKMGW